MKFFGMRALRGFIVCGLELRVYQGFFRMFGL